MAHRVALGEGAVAAAADQAGLAVDNDGFVARTASRGASPVGLPGERRGVVPAVVEAAPVAGIDTAVAEAGGVPSAARFNYPGLEDRRAGPA